MKINEKFPFHKPKIINTEIERKTGIKRKILCFIIYTFLLVFLYLLRNISVTNGKELRPSADITICTILGWSNGEIMGKIKDGSKENEGRQKGKEERERS